MQKKNKSIKGIYMVQHDDLNVYVHDVAIS